MKFVAVAVVVLGFFISPAWGIFDAAEYPRPRERKEKECPETLYQTEALKECSTVEEIEKMFDLSASRLIGAKCLSEAYKEMVFVPNSLGIKVRRVLFHDQLYHFCPSYSWGANRQTWIRIGVEFDDGSSTALRCPTKTFRTVPESHSRPIPPPFGPKL